MPDAIFDHPRVARVYDALDPDRSDLDAYAAMVDVFGARRVLDIGCGTGTLATLLASRGVDVVGVDPAAASLEVARAKPGAGRVRWVHGTARDIPPLQAASPTLARFDLAVMTANVAQVFLIDDDWLETLHAANAALAPGGRLVFETRDPANRAWEGWTKEATRQVVEVPGAGPVESWVEVTSVDGEFVTFQSPTIFHADGERVDSTSTLRFRGRGEVERSLTQAGFVVEDVREAPDRPGREMVFVARKICERSP